MTERPLVHLVGAGPGDPELLTVKAWRLLERADVVVHDRLVGEGVLRLVPGSALRIDVGKRPGCHRFRQEEINELLARLAAPGRTVVRLKGGDPFVFGRGGEEALFLLERGIDVEVVPGVTAAFAAAASRRVPLTHRGVASSVRFLTGHGRDGWWLDVDWRSVADPATTLVLYMALQAIGAIAARLIEGGLDPATPVLAVENASLDEERSLRSTLGAIETEVRLAGFDTPVLFIVGTVVEVLPDRPKARAVARAMRGTEPLLHA
ncbi:Uroporphyrinogen-III C-methyltransferase [bacterium HR40]|nr:Uroporphyrinogen-III C-methyltransferase [bacterium HR40]